MTLFVVSNHLGNPADLSPRAVATLGAVDVIFAEDTRTAAELLTAHGLRKPLRSCFDGNEGTRATEAVELLREGKSLALLSEAGTPAVSDPGFEIVRAAIAMGARVVPIPGTSAVLAALVASGLPPDRFFFGGFPPRKPGARRRFFSSLRGLDATLVFYESPHRTADTLADLAHSLGATRPACVARELTKIHEELVRGTVGDLATRYAQARPLGEITLVVGGASQVGPGDDEASDEEIETRVREHLQAGETVRDVARMLTEETGKQRREMYALVQRIADGE